MIDCEMAKFKHSNLKSYMEYVSKSNVSWMNTICTKNPVVCSLDSESMAFVLVKALYKKKLINEETYKGIMAKYDGKGGVYVRRRFEKSA